jgi:rhodanese-related sulfurtransferase
MFARLMGLEVISPAELRNLMQNESVTVIDVNSRQSWLRARVPGALSLDPVAYSETDLPPQRDSMLVFYCSGFLCRKAPNAARRARAMGHRNVRVLSAGISGWLGASLPTEAGEARRA